MSNSPLLRFESLIRRLVEQPFVWLSGEAVDPFGLAGHLLQLFWDEQQQGRKVAQFTITLNPAHFGPEKLDVSQLEQMVTAYMALLAERTGSTLADPPLIRVELDPSVGYRLATVAASDELMGSATHTEIVQQMPLAPIIETIQDLDAFLIIQGRQHFPLDRPVIRIGRRTDNDVVLDSPSVSRHHAQIRWRDGHFVLFDTSSHGRTLVNGEAVKEYLLRPGDVIALSDVLLIYGEERTDPAADLSQTSPASSSLANPNT